MMATRGGSVGRLVIWAGTLSVVACSSSSQVTGGEGSAGAMPGGSSSGGASTGDGGSDSFGGRRDGAGGSTDGGSSTGASGGAFGGDAGSAGTGATNMAGSGVGGGGGAGGGGAAGVGQLAGYDFRRPVTIVRSGTTLTSHQVLLTLDTGALITGGRLKNDASDLRFTGADGTTPLPHFVEGGLNTGATRVWVRIPTIPNGSTTIYAYYGNGAALDEASGEETFEFFDDFLGSSLDTTVWDVVVQDGDMNPQVSGGELELASTAEALDRCALVSKVAYDGPHTVLAKFTTASAAAGQFGQIGWRSTTTGTIGGTGSGHWAVTRHRSSDVVGRVSDDTGTTNDLGNTDPTVPSVPFVAGLERLPATSEMVAVVDGSTLGVMPTSTWSSQDASYVTLIVRETSTSAPTRYTWDWVAVAKRAAGSIASTPGVEESL